MNNCLPNALDYHIYLLADKASKHDNHVAKSVIEGVKRLKVQMKTNIFNLLGPISGIGFLSWFKLVCDTNGIHEYSAMWILPIFMEKLAAAAQNFQMALSSESIKYSKEGSLTSYNKVITCLLETYATDGVIAE